MVGAKEIVAWQEAPGARTVEHVLAREKLFVESPVIAREVKDIAILPRLLKPMVWEEVCPTWVCGKVPLPDISR